jgi:hypothetical protein
MPSSDFWGMRRSGAVGDLPPATVQPVLENIRRQTTVEEMVSGLDETNALFEARRCLSCLSGQTVKQESHSKER